MNLADEHSTFDTESLINATYTAQADLKILSEWLAKGGSPAVLMSVIGAIYVLHFRLQELSPTLTRH